MKELLIIFLIINAIFWGMFSHDTHTKFCTEILNRECPDHMTLICLSLLCFIVAIFIAQRDFFQRMFKVGKELVQSGGRVLKASRKLLQNTAGNYKNSTEFAESFEEFVDAALE
tara:strand:+ start:4237 stop:4578 length:342 start_codon:yes stop_codon:yes gene_type:complete